MRELIGRTLGHYRIVEKIGEGGMGEVYRAHDERLDREVAIKVLPKEVADKPDRLARFEREARAVAKLSHPNILEIYELGDHEGRRFMATELLEGETLRERLSGASLGWRKATEIGAAIADGLGAAHEAGIVHRDLKPSNVFLTEDGRVKVLDFGLARHREVESDQDVTHAPTITRQTDPGTVLGTVGYMSPEQVRGETADHRSDIFSLGCLLHEMVSGERAFTGDSAVETMNAILKEEPSDVSSAGADLPPELAGTIRRCLEKKPQSRFQSASDLAYNLRTISSASSPSRGQRTAFSRRRSRYLGWAAATAAVLVVAGMLTVLLRGDREDSGPAPPFSPALEWVAVAPFENRTGDASLEPFGQRAADLIVQRFTEVGMMDGVLTLDTAPFPPGGESRDFSPSSTEPGIQPMGAKGPHLLVSGSYYLDGEDLEIQARLTDYETEELVYVFQPVSTTQFGSAGAMSDLGERIVTAVAFHWDPRGDLRLMNPPSSHTALLKYERASATFRSDIEATIASGQQSVELDPEFLWPRISLFWSYLRQGEPHNAARELEALEQRRDDWTRFERIFVDWCAANLHGKRPEALAHLRRMYGIAPHLLWVVYNLSLEMNWQNRPLETIDVLGPILPQYGLESNLFGWRLLYPALSAYHMTGEYEHQLEWSNKGLEAYPAIGDLFLFKGGALAAMGRCEDVSALVGEMSQVRLDGSAQNAGVAMAYIALELRAHGCRVESEGVAHRAADWFGRRAAGLDLEARESSDLYQHSFALRVAGRWDEARSPLEELQKRGFRPFVVAGALGVIAANTGDRGEARRILHEFPKPGPSSDPGSRDAWRAAIAAHLGEKEMAVELLKQSFASGYAHEWYHRIDLDFEPLWDYPPFQELIKPKG